MPDLPAPPLRVRTQQDQDIDEKMSKTVYVVEANSYESMKLWEEFHLEINWQQNQWGYMETVGTLDRRPVCIALLWHVLEGKTVLFFEPTSQVVDYKLIDAWFDRRLPGIPRTNAMNFHHVVHKIDPFYAPNTTTVAPATPSVPKVPCED